MDIRLIDSNFAHATSCSNGDLKIYPKHFNWYRGGDPKEITVFVDGAVGQYYQTVAPGKKIWMLMEPPTITPHIYQTARRPEVQALFDYILTFDKALAATNPEKFVLYALGGCWIEPSERILYPKTKNISIIASEKNFTEGHHLRHQIIAQYGGKVDVYGRGYKFVKSKLEALKDYRYTIVIENCQLDSYFTEKLIDPMVVGTIPIYWGSKDLTAFGDGGIIYPMKDLSFIADDPTRGREIYDNLFREGYVRQNFEKALKFVNTEDWLWENLFSKICTTTQTT